MLRGLYTSATGMIHQSRRLDTIANNLANINTSGYKRDEVVNRSFKDELLLRTGGGQGALARRVGPLNHGVYPERVVTFFEDGILQKTDKITDVALQGQGFFTIQTESGERYTRDGTFKVDAEGRLTTLEGNIVVGQNGTVWVGQQEFEIDRDGNIIIDNMTTDRLQVANFADLSRLEKTGDNLFVNRDPDGNPPDEEFTGEVFQGFIENSNIQPLKEIADMMVAARNYESNQKILQMIDSSLGKAVNEIGNV